MKNIDFKRLIPALRIPCIVAIAFVATWFLVYDVSQISYFAPADKTADFETSDFYQLVQQSRPVKKLCEDVVIVPIDGLSRGEIASVIDEVGAWQPAVIGVDLLWNYPQPEVDSYLVDVLSQLPCRVIVPDTASYIYSDAEGIVEGDVTLSGNNKTIRNLPGARSFAFVAAKTLDAELTASDSNKLIRFGTYDFNIVPPDAIDEFGDEFRDRIVLIGTIYDESDMHSTSVSGSIPGLMIHAESIATMLDSRQITSSPAWLDWIISIIVCSLFVWLSLKSKVWRGGDLIMRLCQFAFLVSIIFFGTTIFLAFDFSINFSRPLLMVASSALAVDLWLGAEQLLFNKK